jgi:holin-like protein
MQDKAMQTIKHLCQLAVLWGIYLLSDYIVLLADLPVPTSVLGIIILFGLLCLGVIRIEQVEGMADFLLRHLVFFFIPIVAGLMEWGGMFREHGLTLAFAIVGSSLAVLFVCAWLARVLYREE